jgi:hypothetical protein
MKRRESAHIEIAVARLYGPHARPETRDHDTDVGMGAGTAADFGERRNSGLRNYASARVPSPTKIQDPINEM